MKIKKVGSDWHEPVCFKKLERTDTGDEYIFVHFLSPVNILIDNKMVKADKGNCILYNKHSHQYIECLKPLINDWIHITGNLDSVADKYGLKYNTLYLVNDSKIITKVVRELEEEYLMPSKYYDELVDIKTEELILKIMNEIESNLEANSLYNQAEKCNDVLKKFLVFRANLRRYIQNEWTLPKMAEKMNFSQARFCKLYKDIFGISPKKDLQNMRIEQAKTMLSQHDYTINTIATMCGYTNRFHFIRTFKKETGMTPLEYAKRKSNV